MMEGPHVRVWSVEKRDTFLKTFSFEAFSEVLGLAWVNNLRAAASVDPKGQAIQNGRQK